MHLKLLTAAIFALPFAATAGVNLNTATLEELASVAGIGQTRAQNIIDYREKNGAFQSVDDLKNVQGFANNPLFEAVKKYLNVGDSADNSTASAVKNLLNKGEKQKEEKSLLKTFTKNKGKTTTSTTDTIKTEIKKELAKEALKKALE